MKIINKNNFFKHTFCEYKHVEQTFFNENRVHFRSKSGSKYFFTDDGVYRYSNHWGRVANCRWKLTSNEKLKNQNYYVGFAKWTDFYPLNETEKQFYISVNFESNKVDFHHKETNPEAFLFFAETAQKRVIQIRKLLADDAWAKYFKEPIEVLREKIIYELCNSYKSLQEIKSYFS